jgi:hypothetical protein
MRADPRFVRLAIPGSPEFVITDISSEIDKIANFIGRNRNREAAGAVYADGAGIFTFLVRADLAQTA